MAAARLPNASRTFSSAAAEAADDAEMRFRRLRAHLFGGVASLQEPHVPGEPQIFRNDAHGRPLRSGSCQTDSYPVGAKPPARGVILLIGRDYAAGAYL